MTQITDSKKAFAEFKFWKNIIVPINKTESVILYPGEDGLNMLFSRDNLPFIFYGKISASEVLKQEISNGLDTFSEIGFQVMADLLSKNKAIKANLKDLKTISGVLKKNVISVDLDTKMISYRFSDKDTGDLCEVSFDLIDFENNPDIQNLEKFKALLSKDGILIGDQCSGEILKLFLDNDKVVSVRTHDKLFEYPESKLFSLINQETLSVRFSEKNEGKRYVDIGSTRDILELHQLFLTI